MAYADYCGDPGGVVNLMVRTSNLEPLRNDDDTAESYDVDNFTLYYLRPAVYQNAGWWRAELPVVAPGTYWLEWILGDQPDDPKRVERWTCDDTGAWAPYGGSGGGDSGDAPTSSENATATWQYTGES
jgi:hypothetical protein